MNEEKDIELDEPLESMERFILPALREF